MSEASKAARAAMKKKIGRLTAGDPRSKVDASSWTPPEMMNTEAKTGLRPVSRRAFKKGGKVVDCVGEDAKQYAGKKPRKADGGEATKYANAKVNRNVKEANAEAFGKPHTGGYRKGGRTHKDMGGPMVDPRLNMVQPGRLSFDKNLVTPGRKDGGKADASQDKKLIKKAFRQHETAEHGGKHMPLKLRKGGKIRKNMGGDSQIDPRDIIKTQPKEAPLPTQEEIDRYNSMLAAEAEAEAAREAARKAREGKNHGGRTHKAMGGEMDNNRPFRYVGSPEMKRTDLRLGMKRGESGKFENPVISRARKADEPMSRKVPSAAEIKTKYQEYRSKKPIVTKELSMRDRLMNKLQGIEEDSYAKGGKAKPNYEGGTRPTGGRLARKAGGRTKKGKTNIHININTEPKQPMLPPGNPMGASPPMLPPRPPMMPPGPPPGAPPGMMLPPGGPMGMPPGGPPMPPPGMMGRKAGGRVGHRTYRSYKDMDAGSGGGLGRLEKTEIQEHKAGRKEGGRVGHRTYRSYKDMDAGSGGGLGRLEKTEIQEHKRK